LRGRGVRKRRGGGAVGRRAHRGGILRGVRPSRHGPPRLAGRGGRAGRPGGQNHGPLAHGALGLSVPAGRALHRVGAPPKVGVALKPRRTGGWPYQTAEAAGVASRRTSRVAPARSARCRNPAGSPPADPADQPDRTEDRERPHRMSRLFRRAGESKSLWQRIKEIALTDVGTIMRGDLTGDTLEKLEELLLAADFGAAATLRLVDRIEGLYREGRIRS